MRRPSVTLILATTLALAGIAGGTPPPGVAPPVPEPADEPPNPERTEPYYDGSVQAPPPRTGADVKPILGAPPELPRGTLFGQGQLPPAEDEEEAE